MWLNQDCDPWQAPELKEYKTWWEHHSLMCEAGKHHNYKMVGPELTQPDKGTIPSHGNDDKRRVGEKEI